jgi:hypothetical protein
MFMLEQGAIMILLKIATLNTSRSMRKKTQYTFHMYRKLQNMLSKPFPCPKPETPLIAMCVETKKMYTKETPHGS